MSRPVPVRYKNWRGVERIRTVIPIRIWFGATKHHPQRQWLLNCIDTEKGVERDFALMDCDFTVVETPDAS